MRIPDAIAAKKYTHLLQWLPEGVGHCRRGSDEWANGYLLSAKEYIEALEDFITALPTIALPRAPSDMHAVIEGVKVWTLTIEPRQRHQGMAPPVPGKTYTYRFEFEQTDEFQVVEFRGVPVIETDDGLFLYLPEAASVKLIGSDDFLEVIYRD